MTGVDLGDARHTWSDQHDTSNAGVRASSALGNHATRLLSRARGWDGTSAVILGPDLCCPVLSCEVLCIMGNGCIGPNRLPK